MTVIGRDAFADFLAGFHIIDRHFATAPLESNAPVLLGLIGLWYSISSVRNHAPCCHIQ